MQASADGARRGRGLLGLEIAGVRAHDGGQLAAIWHSLRPSGAAVAWLAVEPAFDARVESALFAGECATNTGSIAAEVAATAREDLAATLVAALRGKPAVARARLDPEMPPAWLLAHGSGSVALDLTLDGTAIRILVPHAELPRAAPDAREPRAAPVAASAALQHAPVTLSVQVGSVELELGA